MLDEVADFRRDARAWLEENYPESLRADDGQAELDAETMDGRPLSSEVQLWKARIGEKGWGAPAWPRAYGGGGLNAQETRVLQQEMARIGARNPIGGMGVSMLGPTLLEWGSQAQKQFHIPRIARGEVRWCQGFSEPGAGSDLASLQTRCEDKGDHFLVSGQKVWTSGGQFADWCFCLVRTDTTRKQDGISFLLIDMKTPGIEPRPIRLINGSAPFCEVFFTDVRVPKANLVGELNGGWQIAKRLLQFERQGMGGGRMGAMFGAGMEPISRLALRYVGADEIGQLADSDLRRRVIEHQMQEHVLALTGARLLADARDNPSPNAATSILKNVGAKVSQDRAELSLEILGTRGLGWEDEAFSAQELQIVRTWLFGKALSIAGGSSEVQNNIIAKRILQLPAT